MKVYPKLAKSSNKEVREHARKLALVFGDSSALDSLRKTLMDAKAKTSARLDALAALMGKKAKGLDADLHQLLGDPAIRLQAIKALAGYDHAKTPSLLLGGYQSFSLAQRKAALNTFASRTSYANVLLDAIEKKQVSRSDVPADVVLRLRGFDDKTMNKQVLDIWGLVRDTPEAKKKQIVQLHKMLTAKTDYRADVNHGRALFAKLCMQCHTLFGVGGKVAPDITGSDRANVDYFLQNVVDPNAAIGKDYQAVQIETEDGQRHVGIIAREDASAITLKTTSGEVVVPKDEIFERFLSKNSMMPEGLLDTLKPNAIRDLRSYLASTGQVPMLATETNAAGLFNGTDLSNWQVKPAGNWQVRDGMIVGKRAGQEKNGNKNDTAVLVSDLLVADFDLSFQLKLTSVRSKGEVSLVLRGQRKSDGSLSGNRLQLTQQRIGGQAGKWHHVVIKVRGSKRELIVDKGSRLMDRVLVGQRGVVAFELSRDFAGEAVVKDLSLQVK